MEKRKLIGVEYWCDGCGKRTVLTRGGLDLTCADCLGNGGGDHPLQEIRPVVSPVREQARETESETPKSKRPSDREVEDLILGCIENGGPRDGEDLGAEVLRARASEMALLASCKMLLRTLGQLAPWSPDVSEGVVAICDIAHSAIRDAEAA